MSISDRPAAVTPAPATSTIGRRRLFALGGLSAVTGVVVAACGNSVPSDPARVGQAPPVTALPDAIVDTTTHLRTAASVEQLLIGLYTNVIGDDALVDPATHGPLFDRLKADHEAVAGALATLTTAAGGQEWTCANPRLQSVLVTPALERITKGVPASNIPASDDPRRDVLNLVHALESMSASMYQEFIDFVTDPALRKQFIGFGVGASRRAALVALNANTARPNAYVSPADANLAGVPLPSSPATTVAKSDGPAPTEIPELHAIPAQFGQLGVLLLVVGAGDENGVRFKANVETPHDNTRIFDYMTCDTPAGSTPGTA